MREVSGDCAMMGIDGMRVFVFEQWQAFNTDVKNVIVTLDRYLAELGRLQLRASAAGDALVKQADDWAARAENSIGAFQNVAGSIDDEGADSIGIMLQLRSQHELLKKIQAEVEQAIVDIPTRLGAAATRDEARTFTRHIYM